MANVTRRRRKRRDAWASITEVERGRRYRIRYWASEDERGYMRHTVTVRGTREDAERKRAELLLGHSEDAPCLTVQQIWERYALPDLDQRADDGDVSPDTVLQYRRWWAKHVRPRWGEVACDQVRPLEVQQWISGLTRSQAQNAMLVMTKAMDYAVRYEMVAHNPMREKYLMPARSTINRRDDGIWTLPELAEAWRALWGTWMEPAFLLSAFGSCRVGESLGPKAGEVELRHVEGVPVATVPIERQVAHAGGEVVDRLKTAGSRRVAVLVGSAAERIAEIATSMPADWYLTNDGMGASVPQARYTERWRRIGMAHPFRNLRNSWQTWMRYDMRVEPRFIEVMMGHRLKGVTGKHYDRPDADMLCRVAAEAYAKRPYDKGWNIGD